MTAHGTPPFDLVEAYHGRLFRRAQNDSFNPTWIARFSIEVDPILPIVVGDERLALGFPKLGWFGRLKASARMFSVYRSKNFTSFTRPMSIFIMPGPHRTLRALLPKVNGAGSVNAAGLNHR